MSLVHLGWYCLCHALCSTFILDEQRSLRNANPAFQTVRRGFFDPRAEVQLHPLQPLLLLRQLRIETQGLHCKSFHFLSSSNLRFHSKASPVLACKANGLEVDTGNTIILAMMTVRGTTRLGCAGEQAAYRALLCGGRILFREGGAPETLMGIARTSVRPWALLFTLFCLSLSP